jgi:hypothetical protein
MKRILLIWLSTVALAASLRGQTFLNLDFESAQVIFASTNGPHVYIASTNALPGWSAFSGTNQLSLVQYNYNGAVINPPIALAGSNAFYVVNGNFSVYFTGESGRGSINQTAVVPSGAESLLFDATSSSLLVSLGGQNLSYTAISNALNSSGIGYTVYAADISAFAGQIETLTFSSLPNSYGILDDIKFSTLPIPEPTAVSLICLGSGVLIYLRRKTRR